jgi:hypothetical protein
MNYTISRETPPPPPPTKVLAINLVLTLEEWHDLITMVEVAKPTQENTTRRTNLGNETVTYDRCKLRKDLLKIDAKL